jgi:spore maturation protein CgeB
MRIAYFTHSLLSCWNHGNVHFQRGVLRELACAGHEVAIFEPAGAWSLKNLLDDKGDTALRAFERAYPELSPQAFSAQLDLDVALDRANVVIVHEWNEPWLVAAIGRARAEGGAFILLFHDTHHRAISDPDAIRTFDLSGFDGVLAFGEALAAVYRRWGWGERVFVWHEAADTRLFHPPEQEGKRTGLVWIGNWGDGERTGELEQFLLRPAANAEMPLDIYGVRYPDEALDMIARYGANYCGWLPNSRAPEVFARHLASVHVPRRYYSSILPGIPTIRVFETLACGIPLVSAPWEDSEGLFRPGADYLVARSEAEAERCFAALRDDANLRVEVAANGLAAIRARHTCAHRAQELLTIGAHLAPRAAGAAA